MSTNPPPASTHDASDTSQGVGRIRPRARLLRTIGAELISNEVVAIIELVRNCYDADARHVGVHFKKGADGRWQRLSIRDDGHGMSRDILLGPWLEPATDFKSGKGTVGMGGTRSPDGRRRLGSKGVGRFAVQRLGGHLELRTRTRMTTTELVATFDWSELEKGRYLDEVRIPWREDTQCSVNPNGTWLEITELTDDWDAERFERLKLGLSRLVDSSMNEAFSIDLVIEGSRERIRPAIDANEAMYTIEGRVDPGGACIINYTDIGGNREVWEREVIWPSDPAHACGPFSFRMNAWDLDREPLTRFLEKINSNLGLRDFRRVIRDHSGVSLYRDGFRVLPYGEPDNDWLRLDRRRVNNPTMRLSNNQVLGAIQLTADDNPGLRDQTNREGLVTNEAYGHLVEVVTELLGYLEGRRFTARRAVDADWNRRTSDLPVAASGEEADRVAELISDLGQGDAAAGAALADAFATFRARSTRTVQQYAGLATAGQLSGLVFRQIAQPLRQLESELRLMQQDLRDGLRSREDREVYKESVKTALKRVATIQRQMAQLDPLASGGRGDKARNEIANALVTEVVDVFQSEAHRQGVTLELQPTGPEVTFKTKRDVVQQALALLLENAVQAAGVSEASTPMVSVAVTPDGFSVQDNGPGIDPQIVESIWEPHFSTHESAAGMGLTLAKDLLKTVGARVELASPKPAVFRVTLPRA